MKIYAVRHGETDLNKQGLINGFINSDLTVNGIEQAKQARYYLPETIKHFYVSSLNRTKDTAKIMNEDLQIPMTFHDELKEVNFGSLEGTPFLPEYKERHKNLNYDWSLYNGENFDDVKNRVLKILDQIKKENDNQTEVMLVTHGGVIRLLTFLESGKILDEVKNASLHTFDLDNILK